MTTVCPSHGRLITRFNALGPYLRKPLSSHEQYFFDCLGECDDVNLEPEKREFYGWWLVLNKLEEGTLEYQYWFGFYDQQGQWSEVELPNEYQPSIEATLLEFYSKLAQEVAQLELELRPSPRLSKSQVLAA